MSSWAAVTDTAHHFCKQCHALLRDMKCTPQGVFMDCSACSYANSIESGRDGRVELGKETIVITPYIDEGVDGSKRNHGSQRALVDEECSKCHNPQMEFYTLQLRSVDEGSTVFYECPKCGYTYSQNN